MLLHIIEIIDVFTICYFTVECLNVFIKMINSYTFSPRPLVWWSIPKVEYLIRWICAPRKLKFMKVYWLFLLLFGRYRKEPIFKALMQVWRVCKKKECNAISNGSKKTDNFQGPNEHDRLFGDRPFLPLPLARGPRGLWDHRQGWQDHQARQGGSWRQNQE